MTNLEFFNKRWSEEAPITLKVFQAVPDGKLDYRPHPRSRSAGELISLMAYESHTCCEAVDTGKINWQDQPAATEVNQAADSFTKKNRELEKLLQKVDEETWQGRKVQFLVGGQVVFEEALGPMLWGHLFDVIHHRGQLSTYIRPMGGKVPSIYGPSADDTGM